MGFVSMHDNIINLGFASSEDTDQPGHPPSLISFHCWHEKHYDNTPMQYTAIFHGCKNVHFQMKFFNIFLIFAQNIDCGYTLEPPQ